MIWQNKKIVAALLTSASDTENAEATVVDIGTNVTMQNADEDYKSANDNNINHLKGDNLYVVSLSSNNGVLIIEFDLSLFPNI